MATAKPKSKKKVSSRWYTGEVPLEELDPAEQAAHRIVTTRGDLAPSVERVMTSDLEPEQREQAILLFEAALGDLDDPNRDPRVAIEAARGATS